jgi:hypothetical protein
VSEPSVYLDETASDQEVEAVRRLLAEAGLDVEVRASYAQRSVVLTLWTVFMSIPLLKFLNAFAKAYGKGLGEQAAAGTPEAARGLHDWLQRLYASRPGEGWVVLNDDEHNFRVLLPRDLPPEAIEALWQVDPARDGGEAGQVSWDPMTRWTPPF